MPVTHTVNLNGDQCTVALRGEIDMANAVDTFAVLHDAANGDGCRELVIDLAELTFLDSSGLRTLIKLRAHLRDADIKLAMVNPRPLIRKTIEVTGLEGELGLR
jgi:anti-anti-sigma factor